MPDLAIGIPGKEEYGGVVSVVYGGQFGPAPVREAPPFTGGGNTFWRQAITNFPNWNPYDGFGASLAAGNFGNGGYNDLAIGIPGKSLNGTTQCGAVTVLYGSSTGLSNAGSQQWSLHNTLGEPVKYDFFGDSLAAGNLGYDGYDDLAIGVPGHPVSGFDDAGVVSVLYGTSAGLSAANNALLSNSGPAQGDKFGWSLSVAHFGGNSYADVAIGIPFHWSAGSVWVRNGSSTGPVPASNALISADYLFPALYQSGAQFGFAVSR